MLKGGKSLKKHVLLWDLFDLKSRWRMLNLLKKQEQPVYCVIWNKAGLHSFVFPVQYFRCISSCRCCWASYRKEELDNHAKDFDDYKWWDSVLYNKYFLCLTKIVNTALQINEYLCLASYSPLEYLKTTL